MANLKDIKNRIGSVKKTKQITAAMKLVAGAKLRKATERAMAAKPYQAELTQVLGRVAGRAGDSHADPLLTRREDVERVLLVILTSDRGLCGPFNSTLLRRSLAWVERKRAEGIEVVVRTYGRKGTEFLQNRGIQPDGAITDYGKTPKMELVRPLCLSMTQGFASEDFDEVHLAYNTFVNTMVQTPTFLQTIPIQMPESEEEELQIEHLYEPSPSELLEQLLPLYLRTQVLQAFLETEAGEYAARMTAMDNATRNASDLIDQLTLDYNRARQAAITTEIIEIVAGAEAL